MGFPKTIHTDNTVECRSDNFRKACESYNIERRLRQTGVQSKGGHVERFFGTLMTAVHGLPGTTYSLPAEKGDLDPEKRPAMTCSEFESWLIRYVCTVYNLKVHSEIGIPPLAKWRDGLLKSDGDKPPRGLPPRPENGDDILRTFLPRFERPTVNNPSDARRRGARGRGPRSRHEVETMMPRLENRLERAPR